MIPRGCFQERTISVFVISVGWRVNRNSRWWEVMILLKWCKVTVGQRFLRITQLIFSSFTLICLPALVRTKIKRPLSYLVFSYLIFGQCRLQMMSFCPLLSLINADFCVAGCLIAYGAVLGKVSPVQLMVMTLFGITLFAVEEYIILDLIHVSEWHTHHWMLLGEGYVCPPPPPVCLLAYLFGSKI